MKSVGVLKLMAAVIFGGLVGCVTTGIGQERGDYGKPPIKDGGSKSPGLEDVVFKFVGGRLVPHTKDGVPYVSCEQDRKGGCPLYKKDITLTALETVTILHAKSTASPECQTLEIVHGGKVYRFADPFCGIK